MDREHVLDALVKAHKALIVIPHGEIARHAIASEADRRGDLPAFREPAGGDLLEHVARDLIRRAAGGLRAPLDVQVSLPRSC